MNPSAVRRARHASTTLVALSLAAAGLAAAGGSAQADDVVDLSGTITNAAGAPVVGARVYAEVLSGTSVYFIDSILTNAAGQYSFTDLDPATRAADYPGTTVSDTAIRNATTAKLFVSAPTVPAAERHTNPGLLDRYYGGTRTARNATDVPINGAPVSVNVPLPAAAGLVVRVTGATGAPVTDSGNASIYAPGSADPINDFVDYNGGSTVSDDSFYDNPATPDTDEGDNAPKDGLVYLYNIEPGSYSVDVSGADSDPVSGAYRSYASRFIGGDGTYTEAVPVTLTAGAFASAAQQLTDVLTVVEAPHIVGDSSFGSTLVADPGVWLQQSGTEYRYQWTRNGVAVPGATLPTYLVTKADKKKKIGVVVTATSLFGYVGTATAAPTSKVGEKAKVKAKKGPDYSFKVTVTAKKKKFGPATGKVVLLTSDYQVASKKAKLKGGSATLTPKREFLSEDSFIVQYVGGGKLGSAAKTAKLGGGGKK